MRFHVYTVIVVLLISFIAGLALREMLILLFTVSLVLVAEMFNSAIEATVDLVSPNYHPLAKFAKDIAAGAVLVTTVTALIIGALLILGDRRFESIRLGLTQEGLGLPVYTRLILGALAIFFIVVIGKGLGGRGQVLRGGLVSGHAAYGFFFAVSTIFLTDSSVAAALAILLACIVAQSRWEAQIHSVFELTLGAGVGSVVAVLAFGLIPR